MTRFSPHAIGRRLRELRGDMTLAQAAERIGSAHTLWRSWELGEKTPAARSLFLIARAYGVSVDWILGLE